MLSKRAALQNNSCKQQYQLQSQNKPNSSHFRTYSNRSGKLSTSQNISLHSHPRLHLLQLRLEVRNLLIFGTESVLGNLQLALEQLDAILAIGEFRVPRRPTRRRAERLHVDRERERRNERGWNLQVERVLLRRELGIRCVGPVSTTAPPAWVRIS